LFCSRNPYEREALVGRRVSIIGCGSFGSALADMLVRAGLGQITLIDPETLAIGNIGRHVLTRRDLGRPKVHALAEHLLDVNPDLEIDARQESFSDGAGLLVCCADSRRCESMVNAVSLQKQIPAVFLGAYGAVRAAEIQFCVPGQTPCRECFASFRPADEHTFRPERYTDPDFDETRIPGQRGLWGSVLAVSGVAFHGILALLGVRGGLDLEHPLWIVNLDYAGFQPYAAVQSKLRRGCAVCDESKISGLSADD
jgi:molybdopterin/thiamine biosynthesis adenylyltransferase